MNRCLICGKKYSDGTYHPKCSHTLFGSPTPPVIEYTWQELNSLAEKIIRNRITVTGVQPKLSLHIEKNKANSARLTIVGFEGGYILKPPTTHFPLMPEAEHFCMTLARHCKIKTAEFGLIKLKSGEKAYITKRMDRTPDGPLHMEDFCQLTNRLTEDKYRSSMEQVGKALRRFSSIPGLDVISLFEIAVFSFLTGNSDMHLKNFSLFRLNNGTCRLTPAYDLLPVKILMPEDSEELALTLNGKKKGLTRNDFLIFGERLKMTEKQTENALNRIVSGVLDNLPTTMKDSFLPDDLHKQIANLAQKRSAILVN